MDEPVLLNCAAIHLPLSGKPGFSSASNTREASDFSQVFWSLESPFLHLLNRDTMVGRRQCPRMLKSAVPRIAEVSETPLLLTVADVTESVVVIFVH